CCLFNDAATPHIYTLSLHDALPIFLARHVAPEPLGVNVVAPAAAGHLHSHAKRQTAVAETHADKHGRDAHDAGGLFDRHPGLVRSEEHTSELQSREKSRMPSSA